MGTVCRVSSVSHYMGRVLVVSMDVLDSDQSNLPVHADVFDAVAIVIVVSGRGGGDRGACRTVQTCERSPSVTAVNPHPCAVGFYSSEVGRASRDFTFDELVIFKSTRWLFLRG